MLTEATSRYLSSESMRFILDRLGASTHEQVRDTDLAFARYLHDEKPESKDHYAL